MVEQEAATGPLAGQKVAFTGRLASMSRAQAIELVHKSGGAWHKSVKLHTSMLVVGQEGWPLRSDGRLTVKLQLARELQRTRPLTILSEAEFLSRLGSELSASHSQCLSTAQVSQILKVPGERIRGWVRLGLVQPVETLVGVHYFNFSQVSWTKTLLEFMKAGVTPARIRRNLEKLRTWLPGVDQPLEQVALLESDTQLVVRLAEGHLAEASGQGLLDFADDSGAATVKVMSGPQSADEWFQLAYDHEAAREFDEAAKAYRQALLVGGPVTETCFNLANVLYYLGRREQAVERYYQTVEMDPGCVEAWHNLANVLGELEQFEQAIEAYRKVLQLNPAFLDAHYGLADTLDQTGREREALPHWQAYLSHDPASTWGRYARRRLIEIERKNRAT